MLDVIWEDPHGLAVAKPAGLLTHPGGSGDDEPTLEAMVRRYLRPDDPGSVYLGTVHRLDRPVSGVILFAKTPKAAQRWAAQFARRSVRKEYWAIVDPGINPDKRLVAVWDDWLAAPDRTGRARVLPNEGAGLVRAITGVEPGDPDRFALPTPLTWLRLLPNTGRTHQLRAQASAHGAPIVGDTTYGSQIPFDSGIALHARTLLIEHPVRRTALTITAHLPTSWSRWSATLE